MNSAPHLARRKLRSLFESAGIQTSLLKEYGQSWSLVVDFSPVLRGLRRRFSLAFLAEAETAPTGEVPSDIETILESGLEISKWLPAIILTQNDWESDKEIHPGSGPWLWQHYPPFVDELDARGASFIRDWLLQRVAISSVNPYQTGTPTPENMFFGRRSEIEAILKADGSVIVVGPRRIGKTSVARKLTKILERDPGMRFRVPLTKTSGGDRYLFSFAYLDMNQLSRADDIWEALLYRMGLEQRDVYGRHRVKFLTRNIGVNSPYEFLLTLLRAKYRNALFILDEVDFWLERDGRENWPLFSHIRALVEDNQAATRFVLVGYERLLQASKDRMFPLFGRSSTLQLGGLGKKAITELIEHPIRELGLKLRDLDSIVDLIFAATGGLPHLVQEVCRLVVDEAGEDRRHIDPALISATLTVHGIKLSEALYESFKHSSSPLMRLLAYVGAHLGKIHLFDLLQELQLTYRLDLSYRDLDRAATALCVHNVLRQIGPADFEFTNDLFRERLDDALSAIGPARLLHSLAREVEQGQRRREEEDLAMPRDTHNTYNLHGTGSRITINSLDNSHNSAYSLTESFEGIRRVIGETIGDVEERRLLEERLEELERSVDKPSFASKYREFIAIAANHAEALGPFLPGIAAALSK